MKRQSLELLYRYRDHLLRLEQLALRDKIEEEGRQLNRMEQLQVQIRRTHEAKLKARTVESFCVLDEAAAYLHGRLIMARRSAGLSTLAREEAMERTLEAKKARDQVGLLLENMLKKHQYEADQMERRHLDDLASARHAFAWGGNRE